MLGISWILYLFDVVNDQRFLSVIIIVQVQHRGAEVVQEEALGPFIAWVKWIHNDGLSPFDLTATEWATLTIGILQKRVEDTLSEL